MEIGNEIKDFNIAEALKYAPKGLKLYSPIFGEVKFEEIDEDNWIQVRDKYNNLRWFYKYGTYFPSDENNYTEGECLLFPSIKNRCWNNWQNTLFLESIGSVCVDTITGNKFILDHNGTFFSDGTGSQYSTLIDCEDSSNYLLNSRYASPEEAKEFFEELEKNGYMWNEKMVVEKEQNKPKFKIGDWIVNDYCSGKVIALTDDAYLLDSGQGIPFSCEHNVHLWTIADAKDGDVLAAQECYVIFKEIDGLNIKCHCTYHYMGFNPSFHINTLQNKTAFHPATKEECEQLFKKMKEEGYQWDDDAKKLIKTTTPIPKFKVGDVIKHKPTGQINTIKKVCSEYYILDSNNTLYFEAQDIWELIASKVKPTLEEKVNILADEIIALKQRVLALEIHVIKDMSTPPLTKDPILYPDKVTCNDVFKTPDRAGDNVTLEEMRNECKG